MTSDGSIHLNPRHVSRAVAIGWYITSDLLMVLMYLFTALQCFGVWTWLEVAESEDRMQRHASFGQDEEL